MNEEAFRAAVETAKLETSRLSREKMFDPDFSDVVTEGVTRAVIETYLREAGL